MPRDDLINGTDSFPEGFKDEIDLFRRDLESSHIVTTTILSCLSDLLEPPIRFEDYHHGEMASQSTMMYFRYAKQSKEKDSGVGHNMHTDLGTLTLLYCEQLGLQVYNRGISYCSCLDYAMVSLPRSPARVVARFEE